MDEDLGGNLHHRIWHARERVKIYQGCEKHFLLCTIEKRKCLYVLPYQDYQIQVSFMTQYNDSSLNSDSHALSRLRRRSAAVYISITRQILERVMGTHDASHWF